VDVKRSVISFTPFVMFAWILVQLSMACGRARGSERNEETFFFISHDF
jgi:hypothetical protein